MKNLRFKLIGDHSRQHSGSRIVAKQLRKSLLTAGRIVEDDSYDVMVINGQGSMHHDHQHCRAKLRAARTAIERNKRVWLINSTWQNNKNVDRELLEKIEKIVVREKLSQKNLESQFGIRSEVTLDFSLFYKLEKVEPSRDFNGEIAITDFYSAEFDAFMKIVGGELRHFQYISLDELPWADLVQSLKSCELLITGRMHGVYAACLAKVPFVALKADSHKIEGFIQTSGIDIPVYQTAKEIPGAIAWARRNHDKYLELFSWLNDQTPWTPSIDSKNVAPKVKCAESPSFWKKLSPLKNSSR